MRFVWMGILVSIVGSAQAGSFEAASAGAGLPFDGAGVFPSLRLLPAFPPPTLNPEMITLSQLADRLSQDPQNIAALIDAIRNKAGEMGKGWPGMGQMDPAAKEKLIGAIQKGDKSFLDSFPVMTAEQLKIFITLYARKQGPIPPEPPYASEEELSLPGAPHDALEGAFLTQWGRGLYRGDHTAHGLATAYGDNIAMGTALDRLSLNEPGKAAGYTLKLPLEDRRMQSRKEFLDDIAVSLGGFIAEKMIFDDVTTGASNDLQVLTALAHNMVARYGMSDKMGPIAFVASAQRAMFGEGVEGEQSEQVAAAIDDEVRKIIDGAYKKAEEVMKKHRPVLDAIAAKLIEVETIERDEFEKILVAHGIVPKKKEDIEHAPLV